MTTQPSTYFKLGLFVIVAIVAGLAATVALGARAFDRDTVRYHMFFNESVQGLDVGAPVKFRGVTIGIVSAVDIAPDQRHVDVVADLVVSEIRRMGLAAGHGQKVRFEIPSDLRAQLGMEGITGVKFVSIDFFDPSLYPPSALPFEPPDNFIPTTPSLLKNVEDRIVRAVEMIPEVGDKMLTILGRIDALMADMERQGLSHKTVALVEELTGAVRDARGVIRDLDRARIPAKVARSFDRIDVIFSGMEDALALLGGPDGLLASTKRATDTLGDLGRSINGGARDAGDTLRDLSDAAQAVRSLAEALERDPDMLLKGRAKERRP
jgi:paraquat-inducible protein B